MITGNVSRITTRLSWDDLVLDKATLKKIFTIKDWLKQPTSSTSGDESKGLYKAGYKVLFTGPATTQKGLSAALLGKEFQQAVYGIDLSKVVSKYIGETEKNLEKVFSRADNKNWILFFDEADALFGKRTNVKDSHDRFAGAEVSCLLQRMEEYEGLTILAANIKSNIDNAFIRRFQLVVRFPPPSTSLKE